MRPKDGGPELAALPNLSLRTKGVLVVAIPVCALLVAMVVFYRFDQNLQEEQVAVERSFNVRSDIRDILIGMVDAETGIRGFLLSHNRSFLEPYESARRQLPHVLDHLHRTISPEQAPRLASVDELVGRILASLDRGRQTPGETALDQLQADKMAMDTLRGQLAAMQEHEDRLLALHTAEEGRLEAWLRSALFAGGALGLLGGIVGVLLFTAGIARRIERLANEAREVAGGHIIDHPISGHDELAHLERTLQQTSQLLARQSTELRAGQSALEELVMDRTAELETANEELRQMKEISEAVIESSPLAIWAIDLKGKVQFWNSAAERIFGWAANDVIGRWLPVIPPDQVEEYDDWVEGFRKGSMVSGVERKRQRKDGKLIDVVVWTAPLRDAAGEIRGTLAIDSDVSQHKLLEEQFRQSQKLEAVGQLAGGVAHDFNNLLTIIQGYTEMVMMEAPEAGMQEYAQEIQYAATRATALTTQLLAFSRRQISQPKVLDMNEVVSHSMKLLRRIIGEDIDVSASLDPTVGRVKIDPVHIDQVIMNLAVNARDAMPQGGRLSIQTSNTFLDQHYIDRHIGVAPGAYSMLAISDTGTGMTAETRSRLFEPFFTTKEAGKGTGLGLAIVYGIVKQAGGEIMVYSELGRGTTFKIYLPMVEVPSSFSAAEQRGSEMGGTETILVCEDDPKIRRLVEVMLGRRGYRVISSGDPAEALEVARNFAEPIHLLLTDIVMPHISGFELAQSVTELRPSVHVLYMSGYTDNRMTGTKTLAVDVPFLQKPFTAAALMTKVREAITQNRDQGLGIRD
jgi:PAS domain S-box-containing protein